MPLPTQETSELPDTLRPYTFHDVDLMIKGNEAIGACPFCCREGKFSVNVETGQWACVICGGDTDKGGGNIYTFLRKLHEMSFEATSTQDYALLASERNYLDSQVLLEWQLAKSVATGDWIVPGYSISKHEIVQLYRYILQADGKRRLLPTPTLGHTLFGLNLWSNTKSMVDICEGPWDGIAWYEMLSRYKLAGDNNAYVPTGNRNLSLLGDHNVVGAPGCSTFAERWLGLFAGKVVNLLYDNDHERIHPVTGRPIPPAGLHGMRRVAKMLVAYKHPPKEVNYLKWHEQGWDPSLPSGYDVRDLLSSNT